MAAQLKTRRDVAMRAAEGAVLAVAGWCMLLMFQVLPSTLADTPGVVVFALAGALVGLTRFGRVLTLLLAVGAVVAVIVAETSLSNHLARRWVRIDPLPDSGVAATIVLGAGVRPDTTINAEAADRLLAAIEVTRRLRIPLLVTTTVVQRYGRISVSSEPDQGRLIDLTGGGPRWLRIMAGGSTRDEAVSAVRALAPTTPMHILVVTSPLHTRRACATFEAVGFVVTCVSARTRTSGGLNPPDWPRDRFATFGDWVYEVAGMAKYRLHGWVSPRPLRSATNAKSP